MSGPMIALAQVNPCVGDLSGNAAIVRAHARKAADAGARLVAFPEMVLTGYPIEDLAFRASFQRAADAALTTLAADLAAEGLGDLTVVVGTLGVSADGAPLNQAAVLHDGAVTDRYTKHHLPNYGVFDERRIFAPGDDSLVIEVDGARVGLVICEDIWQDGGPVTTLSKADLDLLLVLNGSPFEEGKGHTRTTLARRRAAEVGAPLAYVNMWGGQDDLVFDGHSFIVAADGTWLANSPGFEDDLLTWTVPDRAATPQPGRVVDFASDDEQAYRAVVTGLRDYVEKNGFTSIVLGVSGGIDSALAAAVAADAIGGVNVVGVSMPSAYSSQHAYDDAADLCKRIGADLRVQPIGSMVDSSAKRMPCCSGVSANSAAS